MRGTKLFDPAAKLYLVVQDFRHILAPRLEKNILLLIRSWSALNFLHLLVNSQLLDLVVWSSLNSSESDLSNRAIRVDESPEMFPQLFHH